LTYLSLLSVSISILILPTISFSISTMASSISSLALFSVSSEFSTSPIYSSIFSLTLESCCALCSDSTLIISCSLGKSFSRHIFSCSTHSYRVRDSLHTSLLRLLKRSSITDSSLYSICRLATASYSNFSLISI
jgi:hypothetical protein